jgi:hypothetical protein
MDAYMVWCCFWAEAYCCWQVLTILLFINSSRVGLHLHHFVVVVVVCHHDASLVDHGDVVDDVDVMRP